jgi:hypothetical protein
MSSIAVERDLTVISDELYEKMVCTSIEHLMFSEREEALYRMQGAKTNFGRGLARVL